MVPQTVELLARLEALTGDPFRCRWVKDLGMRGRIRRMAARDQAGGAGQRIVDPPEPGRDA